MESVNFAMLGRQEAAAEFGKKGTASDIATYDRKESGVIRTWAAPVGFPEKIQPLLQAIALSEYAVFYADRLDRYAGEQIVALDSAGMRRGVLAHTIDVDESALESAIRGTVLEGYARATPETVKSEMYKLPAVGRDGPPQVAIDQCFDVKGVGTVVLGKVVQGTIKQYDELTLYPAGTGVVVKSIQMHDDPVEKAASPARVGLAVKGMRPDGISRGDVLAAEPELASAIGVGFAKSPFYKAGVSVGEGCLVSVGLQVRAAKVESASPMSLSFERPVFCKEGQAAILLKPESKSVRIAGYGPITFARNP